MKLGPVEGSPEEVQGFYQNIGFNIEDFIERPSPPPGIILFIIPILLFVASFALLVLLTLPEGWITFIFLLGTGAGITVAIFLMLRYKNKVVLFVALFGSISLMLVALGVSPLELIDVLRKFKE